MRQLTGLLRYAALIPAVLSIVSALFLIVCSGLVAGVTLFNSARLLFTGSLNITQLEQTVITFVQISDFFLISTIILIIGLGIYELFVGKLSLPKLLEVNSIDDLKTKLIGVVISALSVEFLAKTVRGGVEVLSYGGGIALVIASIGLYLNLNKPISALKKLDQPEE